MNFHPTSRVIARIFALGSAVFLSACSTPDVSRTGNTLSHSSQVHVDAVAGSLDSETLSWYYENNGNTVLTAAIKKRLAQLPSSKTSGHRFVVGVNSFRLRTTSQRFWVGVMAGTDYIIANVDVFKDGNRINAFEVDATHVFSMTKGYSQANRMKKMADTLAENLVNRL